MDIWLQSNLEAHDFIPSSYWRDNAAAVREMLPQAELYVYDEGRHILGFVGLMEDYIAGIFVDSSARSQGVGAKLLDHVKSLHPQRSLQVYKKNQRALRFYLRQQFAVAEEQTDQETQEIECKMVWSRASARERNPQ